MILLKGWGIFVEHHLLPRVFNSKRGYEYFSGKHSIEVHYIDGSMEDIELNSAIFEKLKGNHVVHILYAIAIVAAPVEKSDRWIKPIQYGFFKGGYLVDLLEISRDIRSVRVIHESKARDIEKTWTINIQEESYN